MVAALVRERSVTALFGFGRTRVVGMLREHWWIYAFIVLAGAAFTTISWATQTTRLANVEIVAFFPALASSIRWCDPAFRMRAADVLSIVAIWVIEGGAMLFAGLILLGIKLISYNVAFALGLAVIPFCAWLIVRFSLAPTLYLLQSGRSNALEALAASWKSVHGESWWALAMTQLGMGLLIGIPATIVSALINAAGSGENLALTYVASLMMSVAFVTINVWAQAIDTAFATTLHEVT